MVTINGLTNAILNRAFANYLKNCSFNSAEYSARHHFSLQYLVNNFRHLPFEVVAPDEEELRRLKEGPELLRVLAEKKDYEERSRWWEENIEVSRSHKLLKHPKPVTVYVNYEPFRVEIFDYGDNLAAMQLPIDIDWVNESYTGKERIVCPIVTRVLTRVIPTLAARQNPPKESSGWYLVDTTELYTEEERVVMDEIVKKTNPGAHMFIARTPIGNYLPRENDTGYSDMPYEVNRDGFLEQLCGKGLYIVLESDERGPKALSGKSGSAISQKHIDNVVLAAKAIRGFVIDRNAQLDQTAQKYINKASQE